MKNNIDARKDIALKAADAVGRILIKNFKKPIIAKSKGDRNLVTAIDLECESAIMKLIKKYFPEDGILSEESPESASSSQFRWIIDPLDGTHNYIRSIDIFGTSIAVEYQKEMVIGVIYMPVTDELYVAHKNNGAYCNNRKISVSKKPLIDATLIYDSSIRYNIDPMLKGLKNLSDKVFNIRMFGSSARHLSYVAEGKADIDIEFYDKSWDFAAGLLLVEEAGGEATDFKGNKWSADTKEYIASNGVVHQQALGLMANVR
ncbi:MAG: inositol monophosphatase [Candidatus Omnitrophica bacterium]|nr:inositol monophosphatase [Candidatus Omnitrophota bacterium]